METCFNYVDKDRGFFSSDERKWISKIKKLAKKYPDKVEILAEPETNDGCIYCRLPTEWLKITPPRSLSMTEEQKSSVAQRLAHARANRRS